MEYYKLLQLDREPFSNSPDPDYFFLSGQHFSCLQKLELALRLKRGLNVVIGDVGTGKTTLCRKMIRKHSADTDFVTHLILDPSFSSAHEFVGHLYELICNTKPPGGESDINLKESIKKSLFAQGVDQNKTVTLIIDEGQKIPAPCIEILRELLNFETNTFKLLQIVIFAQLEFEAILNAYANFADRVNLLHYLHPMNFHDSRNMVYHRLKMASTGPSPKKIFTTPALWAIYRASGGYPRKIIHLCHQSLLAMIIQNRSKAGWALIVACRKRMTPPKGATGRPVLWGIIAALVLVVGILFMPSLKSSSGISTRAPSIKIDPAAQIVSITPTSGTDKQSKSPVLKSPESVSGSQGLSGPGVERPSASDPEPDKVVGRAAETVPLHPAQSMETTASPSTAPYTNPPPEHLGRVVVKPGDRLADLVQLVYGEVDARYFEAVIAANPRIQNPDMIEIGYSLVFPAVTTLPPPTPPPCWWVVLEEEPSLPVAVERYRELIRKLPFPLQLISSWTKEPGLRFQIILKGNYGTENEALAAVRKLRERSIPTAAAISGWPAETMYYARPTIGGIQDLHNQR